MLATILTILAIFLIATIVLKLAWFVIKLLWSIVKGVLTMPLFAVIIIGVLIALPCGLLL